MGKAKSLFLAGGILLLLAGVASAAIPDSGGVIHGCYKLNNPAKGSVLVVDSEASETCPSGFASLNWNQTGPQGPAGATQALDFFVVREEVAMNSGVEARTTGSASCPTGYVLTGGGWETDPLLRATVGKAQVSGPAGDVDPINYAVSVYNESGGDSTLRIQAICARLIGG